jgi:tetratricopeptide (TPR) repeat protein
VKLELELNADKMLLVRATAGNKSIMIEPISPYINKEMSTEERIKFKAERDFNLECEQNGGEPSFEALNKLHAVYAKIGLEFKAAETLEQIEELYPGKANLNNIGLHYSNAGKVGKAITFYEKSMEKSPSSTTAFNLAIQHKNKDSKKYIKYLEKANEIDPNHNPSSYNLGQEYKKQGKKTEGDKLLTKAFNNWNKKFEENNLKSWDYSWFASCAKALGKYDYAEHIENSQPKNTLEKMYNSANLTEVKQEQGLTKRRN